MTGRTSVNAVGCRPCRWTQNRERLEGKKQVPETTSAAPRFVALQVWQRTHYPRSVFVFNSSADLINRVKICLVVKIV